VIIVLIFSSLIILLGGHLRILELSEQTATSLGVRTDLIRLLLVLSGVFLIAYATAVTGPIAFVSFLSGPIAKKWVGRGLPSEFPAGLIGAILVLGSDLIGQYAFSTRFPVGVITGILGSPYLLYLIIRMNRQGG
jgi:iron complex transport system permease protein